MLFCVQLIIRKAYLHALTLNTRLLQFPLITHLPSGGKDFSSKRGGVRVAGANQ